jgi:hypothetical protein
MNRKKSVARNDAPAATLSYPEMSAMMIQALDTIATLIPSSHAEGERQPPAEGFG